MSRAGIESFTSRGLFRRRARQADFTRREAEALVGTIVRVPRSTREWDIPRGTCGTVIAAESHADGRYEVIVEWDGLEPRMILGRARTARDWVTRREWNLYLAVVGEASAAQVLAKAAAC